MNSNEKDLRLSAQQDTVALLPKEDKPAISNSAISRRSFLAGGTAVGASLLLGRVTRANGFAGVDGPLIQGGNCCGTVVVSKKPQFWPWRSIDPMRASKTSISTKPRKTAGL